MDMNLYSDFRNALFNLESGWPYYYWFKENVRKLNELKEFAYNNKKEFGRAFVFFEKRKNGTGKYYSSIVDIFWSILPVLIVLFEILYLL